MRHRIAVAALLAVTMTGGFCHAADPRYPDWPCVQAKVPEISLAAVWAGPPLDDVSGKWKDDDKVSALVAKLPDPDDLTLAYARMEVFDAQHCSLVLAQPTAPSRLTFRRF